MFLALKIIYTNRYREFIKDDKSKLVFFLFYFFILIKCFYIESIYVALYFIFLFHSQCVTISIRKDLEFLDILFKKRKKYIIFFDLLIINFPILLCLMLYNIKYSIYTIPFLFIYPFLSNYKSQILFFKRINFSSFNPSINEYVRKNKFLIFIPFLLLHYVSYEGITSKNINLLVVCISINIILISRIFYEKEYLHFIKISKISTSLFVIKNSISYISFFLLIELPIIFTSLIFGNYIIFLIIIYSCFIVSIIYNFKYLIKNDLIRGLVILITTFSLNLIYLEFDFKFHIIYLFILITINTILLRLSVKKINNEMHYLEL